MEQEAGGCSFMYVPSLSSVSMIHVRGFEPSSWKIFVAMLEHVISLDLRRELSSEFVECMSSGRAPADSDGGGRLCLVPSGVPSPADLPRANSGRERASLDRSDGVVSTRQKGARLTRTQPRMLRSWA